MATQQLGAILARVAQELEGVQTTLQVQFTRIAELQAELDDIRKQSQQGVKLRAGFTDEA
jgi:hypothetical protein